MQANTPEVELLSLGMSKFKKEKDNFILACVRPPYNVELDIFTS